MQCSYFWLAMLIIMLRRKLDNTGVLRLAQWERKFRIKQKGKSQLDFDFQYESTFCTRLWPDYYITYKDYFKTFPIMLALCL